MDRRLFFKNLLGGTAAVAIAPKLFDQIVEQEYLPPLDGPPSSSEMVFNSEAGLWVFSNEILIAYGGYRGVALEVKREMYEINSKTYEIYSVWRPKPYVDHHPGPFEGSWHVEDLIIKNPYQMLELDTPVHIICKTPEHDTIESDAMCRSISAHSITMTQSLWEANFDIIGEVIQYS